MRCRTQAQDLLTPFLGWLLFAWDCCRRRRTTWSMEPPLERINPLPRRAATTSAPPPWAHTESRRLRRLLSKAKVPWLPPTYGPGPTIGSRPTSHYFVMACPQRTWGDNTLRVNLTRFHLLLFNRNHDFFFFFSWIGVLICCCFFYYNELQTFLWWYLFTLISFHVFLYQSQTNPRYPLFFQHKHTYQKAEFHLLTRPVCFTRHQTG